MPPRKKQKNHLKVAKLCKQIQRHQDQLDSLTKKKNKAHRMHRSNTNKINAVQVHLDTLHKAQEKTMRQISKYDSQIDTHKKDALEKRLKLDSIDRLNITEAVFGENFNVLRVLVTRYLCWFDGFVSLLHLFLLNRETYKTLRTQFQYGYGHPGWDNKVIRPKPLVSELFAGNRISYLCMNKPAVSRRFFPEEKAIFEECAELQQWSKSELLTHKLLVKTRYVYYFVPDVELSDSTLQFLSEEFNLTPGREYGRSNLFLHVGRFCRNKLWALEQTRT